MTVLDWGTELLALARRSIDEGRPVAGRALLDAARASVPTDDGLDEMDARLMLDEGRLDAAGDLASRAVARSPEDWRLRCLRADVRLTARDAVGAAEDAAEAVVMAPREPAPKAALGSALLLLGHAADAAACLTEAVAANPGHVGYRLTLSRALAELGEKQAARATLEEAIGLRPRAPALRIAAIRIALNQHDLSDALALADDAREQGVIDACILGLRGHILSCLGDETEAVLAYQEALQLAPRIPTSAIWWPRPDWWRRRGAPAPTMYGSSSTVLPVISSAIWYAWTIAFPA